MALQPPERTKVGPEAQEYSQSLSLSSLAQARTSLGPASCVVPQPGGLEAQRRPGFRRSFQEPKAEHETSHSPKTFKRTPIRRRTLEGASLKCARNSRVAPNYAVFRPTGGDIADLIPTEPPPVASRAAASAMTVGERGNYNNDGGARPGGLRFLVGLLNVDDELH